MTVTLCVINYPLSQYLSKGEYWQAFTVFISRPLLVALQYLPFPVLGIEPKDSYMLPVNVPPPTLYLSVWFGGLKVVFPL